MKIVSLFFWKALKHLEIFLRATCVMDVIGILCFSDHHPCPWRCLPFIQFTKGIIPYTNVELASYNYQYIQKTFRNNDLIFLTLFLECTLHYLAVRDTFLCVLQ